jgi:hypothetical protein
MDDVLLFHVLPHLPPRVLVQLEATCKRMERLVGQDRRRDLVESVYVGPGDAVPVPRGRVHRLCLSGLEGRELKHAVERWAHLVDIVVLDDCRGPPVRWPSLDKVVLHKCRVRPRGCRVRLLMIHKCHGQWVREGVMAQDVECWNPGVVTFSNCVVHPAVLRGPWRCRLHNTGIMVPFGWRPSTAVDLLEHHAGVHTVRVGEEADGAYGAGTLVVWHVGSHADYAVVGQ